MKNENPEIQVPAEIPKQLHEQLLEGVHALVDQVQLMEITTQQEADFAGTLLVLIDEKIQLIHALLDPFVDPPYKAYKSAYDYRALFLNDYQNCRTIIRGKITEHLAEQRRIAQEIHAKSQTVLQKKGLPTTELVMAAPKVAGLSTRKGYTWKVVDEKLVPDELWILDEKEINARVKRKGLDAKIPGIKVTETDVPVNRK
jgi:hypothetical protein